MPQNLPPVTIAPELRQSTDERTRDDAARVALIERSILVLLVVGLLIGVLAVVRPFTTAILFGASLATAAWPIRQALVRRGLGHGLAAALLLLLSLVIVVLPMLAFAPHLADQIVRGTQRLQSYFAATPERPAWIGALPLGGRRLGAAWDRVVEVKGNLRALLEPYTANVEEIMIGAARALADSLVQVILSLVVATMLWVNGDALVSVLHEALRRLGGPIAERALDVAAGAIRGVAYGVVGTAAIQAVLLAIGLAVAGVPAAGTLGFVALLLAISQIGGPLLILIWGGAAWWLFARGPAALGRVYDRLGPVRRHSRQFHQALADRLRRRDADVAYHPGCLRRLSRLRLPGPVHRADPDRHRVHSAAGLASRRLQSSRQRGHETGGLVVHES